MNKNNKPQNKPWPRAIIHVDMNAFFASIEQLDCTELRGQAVAVTNGAIGTCIITSSYEARAYGIKTGMRLKEARTLCPSLIQCPARPERYAAVSTQIMNCLQTITPDIEVYSVDEAFLDVTHCQTLWGEPSKIAKKVKRVIFETCGLLCSVGVSGDKTTAKYAAKLHKPNGLTVVPPEKAEEFLRDVPVEKLCGINTGVKRFLARYNVRLCGDMKNIPISVVAKRFGHLGRRLWLMCQGADPDPIHTTVSSPKSMGHGKVLPPNTKDETVIKTYLLHMAEKLAARLRQHQLQAQSFFIGLLIPHWGWLGGKFATIYPCDDGRVIYKLCEQMLREYWHGEGIYQVQITALDPSSDGEQLNLFANQENDYTDLNATVDAINARFGEFTIAPAQLLLRSKMPNVIAPAWKPDGHRRSV